ncbi:putative siderophore-binding lipoprotein YfiY precursor [Vibrio aerogenes CECT 7868]|uniref:Putative siderophore-binding lipoprotein YfiY n=2 Tax=Vibrio aerogenes TaxID=92172 RepID=A0A1M6A5X9_9VIBR|nr:iron-siderophore ABC transporter substrate-binding protein [Vibrio aerogenes]SHI31846.1 putative siderophore-binding lipoprotein YfiY precursor [Vibrio aerogenes CECT 7868]
MRNRRMELFGKVIPVPCLVIFWSLFFGFFACSEAWAEQQVTHAMGTTRVQKTVRVVTLFQGATDSVVALGIRPVGVVDSWAEKPTYRYLRSSLQGVAHVGLETQPNLEVIAALQPDLIIGARSRHEKIYSQLSAIAPTVFADNVYDFEHTLDLVAEATGREQEKAQLWHQWQARVTAFRSQLKKHIPDWPATASVIDVRSDHLRLYLQQSFAGTVLTSIGFQLPHPAGASGWGVKLKSKEALPTLNADVFFVILHSDAPAVRQNYQSWRLHPLWKILKAPKHHQVYLADRTSWLLSGGILGANLMLGQLSEMYHLNSSAL